jgi:hypothetical protein
MHGGPRFADEVKPTQAEIRAWAHSGASEPMQDWDIVIAEPENLEVPVELVGDPTCPSPSYLLGSLYCLAGHSDPMDQRIRSAADDAARSSESWLQTWAMPVQHLLANPDDIRRSDWCGWDGFRTRPDA